MTPAAASGRQCGPQRLAASVRLPGFVRCTPCAPGFVLCGGGAAAAMWRPNCARAACRVWFITEGHWRTGGRGGALLHPVQLVFDSLSWLRHGTAEEWTLTAARPACIVFVLVCLVGVWRKRHRWHVGLFRRSGVCGSIASTLACDERRLYCVGLRTLSEVFGYQPGRAQPKGRRRPSKPGWGGGGWLNKAFVEWHSRNAGILGARWCWCEAG